MLLAAKDLSSVAKPELGAKRQCESCGTKFFDLNKEPPVCPKCGAVFHVTAAKRPAAAADDDEELPADAASPELVSLEDADDPDAKAVPDVPGDDIDLGDDDEADDTFLEEEEEENDDVSGLIDGDIETDDEN